ncbi:SDR family NAD(P)-dependent oxidoreductase, partial [Psychrobacter sp.]|uniref:SDR family NAD(P)-dependent oxidoreductase n=1 Tax=Psychrobacter sp. TaxID=56811 RepID=UPI003565AE39
MTQKLPPIQTMTTPAPVMLVTGSAKRIGAAIVRAAHNQGYRVIIHCHHSEQEAHALADELNDNCAHSAAVIVADLAVVNQADTLEHLTQTIMQAFGQLDVL